MKKTMIRVLAVVLVSIAIEVVIFQGPSIWKLYKPGSNANRVYQMDDFEVANWAEQPDGTLESLADPILVLPADGQQIDTLHIQAEASDAIPYVDVFYINDRYPNYGDIYIHAEDVEDNQTTIEVDDQVQALRVDLGDDPGLILSGLTVTINPVSVDISLSRIVAVNAIYWCGAVLFSMQKMPDYHLDNRKNATETDEQQEGNI